MGSVPCERGKYIAMKANELRLLANWKESGQHVVFKLDDKLGTQVIIRPSSLLCIDAFKHLNMVPNGITYAVRNPVLMIDRMSLSTNLVVLDPILETYTRSRNSNTYEEKP
jgi:hypothetical protein